MIKPDFYIQSDYCGLNFHGGAFYYGYEVAQCSECGKRLPAGSESCEEHDDAGCDWCFSAKLTGIEEIIIPYKKLGDLDKFDLVRCLNTGIGWVLSKYQIRSDAPATKEH